MTRLPVSTTGAVGRSGGIAALVLALALTVGAGSASAHGGGELVNRGHDERVLRDYEAAALGPEHAADHAREREARRDAIDAWESLSAPEQSQARQADQAQTAAQTLAAAGPAAEVGQWTTAPFPIPNYAIHSVVLPTGKVLFWGYPPIVDGARANVGKAALWDPSKGTGPSALSEVAPPEIDLDGDGDAEPAPIYCSGQSFLPNGDVLVTGGNLVWASKPGDDYTEFPGHNLAFTFDPWKEEWTEQPAMRHGRWYPSQVEMADGRTAILSGYSEEVPGGLYNRELEVFTPSESSGGIGTMQYEPSGSKDLSTYPHLFSLPNGDVAAAGPDRWDTAILDSDSLTWTESARAMRHRDASNAVLMPGGPDGSWQIMQIGGYDETVPPEPDGLWPATETAESVDLSAAEPEWTSEASQSIGRVAANTVLLPDGSMVTVGGGLGYNNNGGSYLVHDDHRLRQVEVYDPDTGSWQLGPAQEEDRAYHSTAVLLPDGRVMSAGDDMHPIPPEGGFSASDTAEIYSPPYLFKGTRPSISSAPAQISPGESFAIGSPSSGVSRAVLMAPPATTHGIDMQQRHVELEITSTDPAHGLTVKAPPSFGVAPPGYYMLFLLNAQGAPSVARWVQLAPETEQPAAVVPGGAPKVTVSVRAVPRAAGAAKLRAQVSVDRAATVKISLLIRGRGGLRLGRKNATISFSGAATSSVVVKLKRGEGRPRNALIAVEASDPQGASSAWRRTVRVGP